jgi:hypothetical protein
MERKAFEGVRGCVEKLSLSLTVTESIEEVLSVLISVNGWI